VQEDKTLWITGVLHLGHELNLVLKGDLRLAAELNTSNHDIVTNEHEARRTVESEGLHLAAGILGLKVQEMTGIAVDGHRMFKGEPTAGVHQIYRAAHLLRDRLQLLDRQDRIVQAEDPMLPIAKDRCYRRQLMPLIRQRYLLKPEDRQKALMARRSPGLVASFKRTGH
jgi:hypothetical protein